MSDEIKITKQNIQNLYANLMAIDCKAMASALKKTFPEAFETETRKLELTSDHLDEIWEIDFSGKKHIYWIIEDKGYSSDIYLKGLYDAVHWASGCTIGKAKFLAPSLSEYLKNGGKVY